VAHSTGTQYLIIPRTHTDCCCYCSGGGRGDNLKHKIAFLVICTGWLSHPTTNQLSKEYIISWLDRTNIYKVVHRPFELLTTLIGYVSNVYNVTAPFLAVYI